jgi:hypothetical protein
MVELIVWHWIVCLSSLGFVKPRIVSNQAWESSYYCRISYFFSPIWSNGNALQQNHQISDLISCFFKLNCSHACKYLVHCTFMNPLAGDRPYGLTKVVTLIRHWKSLPTIYMLNYLYIMIHNRIISDSDIIWCFIIVTTSDSQNLERLPKQCNASYVICSIKKLKGYFLYR